MTDDVRMFNSINTNDSNGYDSITFGDNGKGKVAFAPYKTSFVKNNGGYCYSCKQVGHKKHDCKNKKSHANASSIKFDSCHLLTKGANSVKAKFAGTSLLGQRKRPFGYKELSD